MDERDECTNCDEGSAEYHCNTCQASLCKTCRDRHKRKKGTNLHEVVKNSLCKVHTNKVYISCCKQCQVPVCLACMRESHFGHEQTDIDQIFKFKIEEFLTVLSCLKDTLINSTKLAKKIEEDEKKCEDEISELRSKIISRAQAIKDAVNIILHDNIENLTAIKRSLKSDFQTHKTILSDFISKLKYLLKKYEDVKSTELPAEFIMTQKEKMDAMKKLMDIPKLSEPLMPCYEQNVFQQSDIESLLPRVSYLGIVCRERSPRTVSTEKSSESCIYKRTQKSLTAERFPQRGVTGSSPRRLTTEHSPLTMSIKQIPEGTQKDKSKRSQRKTRERSPERVTREQTPKRVTNERSQKRVPTERSPKRLTTEQSPGRVATVQSLERVKTEQSPERVTTDRSPKRMTIEHSPERVTTGQSPEKKTTEQPLILAGESLRTSGVDLWVNRLALSGVKGIYHISSQGVDKFWVSNDAGDLVLTDSSGKKFEKITTSEGTGYHAVLKTGDLIFADKEDGRLKTVGLNITPDPLIETFLETKMKPLSVFVSSLNYSLLVGMKQGNVAQVVRFNDDGEMINRIQYDSKHEPLYKYPHYITENKNGDICVSDYDSKAVVVVNSLGNHRFTYTGHPSGTLGYPYGICSDVLGRILFCDSMNYKIHLIDENGTFLSFTLTRDIGKPLAICEDGNGDIWLGAQGKECIMKFTNIVGF